MCKKIYTYYTSKQLPEHYLYASEVADYLYHIIGLKTKNGKPCLAMISAMLNTLSKNLGDEELYYNSKKGLRRVYPCASIVINEFGIKYSKLEPISSCKPGQLEKTETIFIDGRKYTYKFGMPYVSCGMED